MYCPVRISLQELSCRDIDKAKEVENTKTITMIYHEPDEHDDLYFSACILFHSLNDRLYPCDEEDYKGEMSDLPLKYPNLINRLELFTIKGHRLYDHIPSLIAEDIACDVDRILLLLENHGEIESEACVERMSMKSKAYVSSMKKIKRLDVLFQPKQILRYSQRGLRLERYHVQALRPNSSISDAWQKWLQEAMRGEIDVQVYNLV